MRVNGDEAGQIFAWGTLKTKRHNQEKRILGLLATRSTYTRRSRHLDSLKNPGRNPGRNPPWYGKNGSLGPP